MDVVVAQIAELFEETAEAHLHAFEATEGKDPEWPLWYAEYMKDKLGKLLVYDFTISELVYWLITLDKTYREQTPGEAWTTFYGGLLVNEFIDA